MAFLVEPTSDAARPRTPRDAVSGGTMCRLYKLSFDQFVDVLIQENDGNPHDGPDARERTRSVVAAGVEEAGGGGGFLLPDEVLPDGWYRRLVTLGERGGTPILSFTVAGDVAFNAPSERYLKTIVLGLLETYPQLTPGQIVAYLKRTSRGSPGELKLIVDQAVQTYVETSLSVCARCCESADLRGIGSAPGEGARSVAGFFRVLATKRRENTRREYIVQLPTRRMAELGLSKRELVAVAAWHHGVEYRVLATVLPSPGEVDDASRTIGDTSSVGRFLTDYEIALDQKLRVAIGVRLGDWVAVHRLTRRRPLIDSFHFI